MMNIRLNNLLRALVYTSTGLLMVLGINTPEVIATPISVPNHSFEANVLGDGGSTNTVDDWTVVTTGLGRTFNPTNSQFSGTTGGNAPAPAEGINISLSNLDAGEVTSFTSAASLASVISNATYTITVAFGNRAGSGGVTDPDQYTLQLLVDGTPAVSSVIDGNAIADDSFQDFSTFFQATAIQDGGDLTARIIHTHIDGSTATGHFDNVRLDFTPPPIPEPSTVLLLSVGLLGFVHRNRRKRAVRC